MRLTLLITCLCLLSISCGQPIPKQPKPTTPLYDRIGGDQAISTITDVVIDKMERDKRMNAHFEQADISTMKAAMVTYFCQITSGPCHYQGKTMAAAHAGRNITPEQFDLFMHHLTRTMIQFHVPLEVQKEFLNLIGPLKQSIVKQSPRLN